MPPLITWHFERWQKVVESYFIVKQISMHLIACAWSLLFCAFALQTLHADWISAGSGYLPPYVWGHAISWHLRWRSGGCFGYSSFAVYRQTRGRLVKNLSYNRMFHLNNSWNSFAYLNSSLGHLNLPRINRSKAIVFTYRPDVVRSTSSIINTYDLRVYWISSASVINCSPLSPRRV